MVDELESTEHKDEWSEAMIDTFLIVIFTIVCAVVGLSICYFAMKWPK